MYEYTRGKLKSAYLSLCSTFNQYILLERRAHGRYRIYLGTERVYRLARSAHIVVSQY